MTELQTTENEQRTVVREIDVKSVLTKSNLPVADYSVNPYLGCTHACKYCYASFMKRFTSHSEPWGEFLDVKRWPELKRPQAYAGKELFFGSVTDPYLPEEETYARTRTLLTQLQGSGASLSIATKSDLVLRDLDLIRTFPNARVSWSINTLDDSFQSDMDCAASIERRIAAMKAFHDAGVRTTCFISPIFPGITDVKAIIRRAKDICNLVWLENLNLRGSYRPVILSYIAEKHAALIQIALCVLLLLFAGIATAKFKKVFDMCGGYEDPWTRRGSAALFAFGIGMVIASFVLAALPFCFHGFYHFFLMRC